MQFKTKVPKIEIPKKFGHKDAFFFIGSCFAEEIGAFMERFKFNCLKNPFGPVYNPITLHKCLESALLEDQITESEFIKSDGLYCHFDFHHKLCSPSAEGLKSAIDDRLARARAQLSKASLVVITLGSSRVFNHLASNQIVGNCHKLPAKLFERSQLSVEEVKESIAAIHSTIKSASNVQTHVIYTVSPIRHLRDGLIANQRSKAVLLSALHEMVDSLDSAYYFPSYEIMIDELRDYRYFQKNMTHPTDLAIEYIWEWFSDTCLNNESKEIIIELEKMEKMFAHRPFHPYSEKHKTFLQQLQVNLSKWISDYPFLNFDDQLEALDKRLNG